MQRSPDEFATRHLIAVAGEPVDVPGGGELLLQSIAGDTLARCRPMSVYPPAERVQIAAAVVRALTQDWTEESALRHAELTVAGFIRDGLDGTSPGYADPA
jgi:hypothetical protein